MLQFLPPETAHSLAIRLLANVPLLGDKRQARPRLAQSLWGLDFPNPLGMAAGFDKDAQAYNPLLRLGFGFVEVGSITPQPQPGNPKPRVFRLRADGAVINRYGFNSKGMGFAGQQLRQTQAMGTLGINLGKNKETQEAAQDYVQGIQALGAYASYLVINVSSPNTPGLRAEQEQERLRPLLVACLAARDAVAHKPPLLVKIAPDLEPAQLEAIADLALALNLDGVIATNTTLARPASLRGAERAQAGGLSGRPLQAPSTEILRQLARLTQGRVPLIGVGGVDSAEAAYTKIKAGASLVQLYTALVYQGPGLIARILDGLEAALVRDGFDHISQAVGVEV